jgi:hypothetical protein
MLISGRENMLIWGKQSSSLEANISLTINVGYFL